MPFIPEARSRRGWRREVAAYLVERVDDTSHARFVGRTSDARREMLKVAEFLPSDVIAEIYEDPRRPGRTCMELYLAARPVEFDPGFRLVYPNSVAG
jgi:hypothetical protein